jgi:threonine/homoserine/homoserine lactone efflux protein
MFERPDLIIPFLVFCIVMSFTPGPNNAMLMASGLNYGLRKTVPHIFGVALGFGFLGFCVSAGLGMIFIQFPIIYTMLKYLGAVYLLYLAWLIGTTKPGASSGSRKSRPMTFLEAAAFQWVNPKGWVMVVGAASTYGDMAKAPWNAVLITAIFILMGFVSCYMWAGFGSYLQRWLHKPKAVRIFNIIMALLLVASIYPVFTE